MAHLLPHTQAQVHRDYRKNCIIPIPHFHSKLILQGLLQMASSTLRVHREDLVLLSAIVVDGGVQVSECVDSYADLAERNRAGWKPAAQPTALTSR